jgi:S-DNA-T family DNA segregation ATPase FtsK/SpoIIIE
MLAQLTFFQSYRELQIVFIHSGAYTEDFQYMRWYPHLRLEFINVIGEIYSEQIRDQILGSIQQILKERKLKQEEEKKAHICCLSLMNQN